MLAYFVILGLAALSSLAQVLDLTFSTKGMNKIDDGPTDRSKVSSNDSSGKTFLATLSEANNLVSSVRGIGLEYGRSIPLPPETRPLEKKPFLRATFFMFIRSFVLFDILEFTLRLTPPLYTYAGGSIYIQDLPVVQRVTFAMFIHIVTGLFFAEVLEWWYLGTTLIFVGVFNDSPSRWPPLSDHPWKAESITEFWGRRWHQLYRRTLFVLGGYPGRWLGEKVGLSRVGSLFGTFIASGLFHELPCYVLGGYFDWRPPIFFVSQAFLICLERRWNVVTGKKVCGWWGRLWVYFVLLTLGQLYSKL